jgi:hypothetical protein
MTLNVYILNCPQKVNTIFQELIQPMVDELIQLMIYVYNLDHKSKRQIFTLILYIYFKSMQNEKS